MKPEFTLQHPELFSTCSTTGPLDLAASLRAAGMLAASWQVEDMEARLHELETADNLAELNFDDAVFQAKEIADKLDRVDAALIDAMSDADADLEVIDPDNLRPIISALLKAMEEQRQAIQEAQVLANAIQDIDNKPADRNYKWVEAPPASNPQPGSTKPAPKRRRRKDAVTA